MQYYCTECKDPCAAVEETWDYPGTHCTHGQSGVHHTGVWVSDCCLEELTTDTPEEQRMNEAEYKGEG